MEKILISMSNQLAIRMKAVIPTRQQRRTFTRLIEQEIKRREKALYECAVAVEKDAALHKEIEEWDITLPDGLDNESR